MIMQSASCSVRIRYEHLAVDGFRTPALLGYYMNFLIAYCSHTIQEGWYDACQAPAFQVHACLVKVSAAFTWALLLDPSREGRTWSRADVAAPRSFEEKHARMSAADKSEMLCFR